MSQHQDSDTPTATKRNSPSASVSNSVLTTLASFFDECQDDPTLLPSLVDVAVAAKESCQFLLGASQPYKPAVQVLEQQVVACWLLLEQGSRFGLLSCILKADDLGSSYRRLASHLSGVISTYATIGSSEESTARHHLEALHLVCSRVAQQLSGQQLQDMGKLIELAVSCPTPSLPSHVSDLHGVLAAWLAHTGKLPNRERAPSVQDLLDDIHRLRATNSLAAPEPSSRPVTDADLNDSASLAGRTNLMSGSHSGSHSNPFSAARDVARLTAHMSLVDPLAGILSVGPALENIRALPHTRNIRLSSSSSHFRRGESERRALDRLMGRERGGAPAGSLRRVGSHGPSHRREGSDVLRGEVLRRGGESERSLVRNSSLPARVDDAGRAQGDRRPDAPLVPSRLAALRPSSRLGRSTRHSFNHTTSTTSHTGTVFEGSNSSLAFTHITPPSSPLKSTSPMATPAHPPQPPEEYLCPISWSLMDDPVVIESGQTYERRVIENWFLVGRKTCPMTGQKLDSTTITPNWVLKRLITAWKEDHGIIDPPKNLETPSVPSASTPEEDGEIDGSGGADVDSASNGTIVSNDVGAGSRNEASGDSQGQAAGANVQQSQNGPQNGTTSSEAAPGVQEDITDRLIAAAEAGQLETVRQLLESGASPNRPGGMLSQPALHYAIILDSEDMVKLLVLHGALPNTRNQFGLNPVMNAVLLRKNNALRGLLSGNVNLHTQCNDKGTPLHAAIADGNDTAVRLLAEHGAPLEVVDSYTGDTPLSLACRLRQTDSVKLLLQHGAPTDPPISSYYNGGNAIHAAVEAGELEIVRILFEAGATGECYRMYEESTSVLHLAAMEGSVSMVELLLSFDRVKAWLDRKDDMRIEGHQNDFYGRCTPLHAAAGTGSLGVVKVLVERGAQVDGGKDDKEATPLMCACLMGYLEVAESLIDAGADVNYRDNEGYGPIHHAVVGSNERLLKLLISRGARVAARAPSADAQERDVTEEGGADGERSERAHGERSDRAVRELTEVPAGEQGERPTGERPTSLQGQTSTGEEGVNPTTERGESPGTETSERPTHVVSSNMVNSTAMANEPGHAGSQHSIRSEGSADADSASSSSDSTPPIRSALVKAAEKGSLSMLKVLLEAGAPVDEVDEENGFTALLQICAGEHDEDAQMQYIQCAELLLQHGADMNASVKFDEDDDAMGERATPLSTALEHGKVGLIQVLLAAGATPQIEMLHALVRKCDAGDLGDMLQLVLGKGLDVNSKDKKGRTLLHIAASCCEADRMAHVLRVLLRFGADVHAKDDLLATPLDYAVLAHELEGVQVLLQAGAVPRAEEAHSTLGLACCEGHQYQEVDVGKWNGTQLLRQSQQGNAAEGVVNGSADDGNSNEDGYLRRYDSRSPVYYNIDYPQCGTAVKILHLLLDCNESLVNTPVNPAGMTPLHIAVSSFNVMLIRALLQRGANANTVDAKGNTPLHVVMVRGGLESNITLSLLLAAGADPNKANHDGLTALDVAKGSLGWQYHEGGTTLKKLEEATTVPSREDPSAAQVEEEEGSDIFTGRCRGRRHGRHGGASRRRRGCLGPTGMMPPTGWMDDAWAHGLVGDEDEAGEKLERDDKKKKLRLRKCGWWCPWVLMGRSKQVGEVKEDDKLSRRELAELAEKIEEVYRDAKSRMSKLGRMDPDDWTDEESEGGSEKKDEAEENESHGH